MGRRGEQRWIWLVWLLGWAVLSLPGIGQASASRTLSTDEVEMGSTFSVTVAVSASQDLVDVDLSESLPTGFSASPITSGGAVYSPGPSWAWTSLAAGSSRFVSYRVTVPTGCSCIAGTYSISGSLTVQSPSTSVSVGGESSFRVILPQVDLTISVVGEGTTSPSGTSTHDKGETVPIAANASLGWEFSHWTGDVFDPSSALTSVHMTSDKSVAAHFVEIPKYGLTITVDGSGTTSPAEGTHTYVEGTSVSVSATPAAGWVFDHWSGGSSGSANPTTVVMTEGKSLTAHFAELPPSEYGLTITVDGNGTTSPAEGTHTYVEGTSVAVSATPAAGWVFDHWSGGSSGSANPTTVVMTEGKNLTASFVRELSGLSISGLAWIDLGDVEQGKPVDWSISFMNPTKRRISWTIVPLTSLPWVVVDPKGGILPAGQEQTARFEVRPDSMVPPGDYRAVFELRDSEVHRIEIRCTVIASGQSEARLSLDRAGWHMVCLPGELTVASCPPGLLCSPAGGDCLMSEIGNPSTYVPVSPCEVGAALPAGRAFWKWVSQPTDFLLPVIALAEVAPVALEVGWNAVGAPLPFQVRLADVKVRRGPDQRTMEEAVAAGWIGDTVFFPDDQAPYVAFRTIDSVVDPWKGFWLRADGEVDLLWPETGSTALVGPDTGRPIAWSTLENDHADLPPLPPASP